MTQGQRDPLYEHNAKTDGEKVIEVKNKRKKCINTSLLYAAWKYKQFMKAT